MTSPGAEQDQAAAQDFGDDRADGTVMPPMLGQNEAPAKSRRPSDFWERRFLLLADLLGVTAALTAAPLSSPRGALFPEDALWALPTLPIWALIFKAYGLYDRDGKRVSHMTLDDLPWLFHAFLIGGLVLWFYSKVGPAQQLVLVEIAAFGGVAMLAVPLLRAGARGLASRRLASERVVLVGEEDMARVLVRKMRNHREYGLEPIGMLCTPRQVLGHPTLPVLGELADVREVVREHAVDRIIVSPGQLDDSEQLELLGICRELYLKVGLLPEAFDALGPAVEVDDVEGVTLLVVSPPVLSRSSRLAKRCLDAAGSALGLFALAPLLALVAVAIKLDSPGPVLFRQRRIGRDGREFTLLKFRTMSADAEYRVDELRSLSKDPNWLHLKDDPRITRVGRLLRLTSLDELPQLWNVLKGEMSLVGPRPLIDSEDRRVAGWARGRLRLTPGLTGPWQVLGRTTIPFEEMVKLDYLYVMNWSLWGDIRLLLRTFPAVLSRRGAN